MALERLLDQSALDAFSASVNKTNLVKPRCVRRADVLLNHGCHVSGLERVEVDRAFDGNLVSHAAPRPGRAYCLAS